MICGPVFDQISGYCGLPKWTEEAACLTFCSGERGTDGAPGLCSPGHSWCWWAAGEGLILVSGRPSLLSLTARRPFSPRRCLSVAEWFPWLRPARHLVSPVACLSWQCDSTRVSVDLLGFGSWAQWHPCWLAVPAGRAPSPPWESP